MKRTWFIGESYDEDGQPFYDRDMAVGEFVELEALLHRLGGVVHVTADRQPSGDERLAGAGFHETHRLLVQYDSQAPVPKPKAADIDLAVVEVDEAA